MISDRSRKLADAIHVALVKSMNFTGAVTVEILTSRPWASVTFTGARHRLLISFNGPSAAGAAADLLAGMDALEIALPGQLLADIELCADARSDDCRCAWLDLEALTIDDD